MPLPKDPIKREESIRKMREAAIKRMADPETRKKVSESLQGRKQPPEVTAKIRASNTGKKRSEEFRKHLSEINWGRKPSEEARKHMSEAQKGKKQPPEVTEKIRAANTGQERSPRTKKTCAYCGKELVLAEWEKNRKFCSTECKGKWQSENAVGESGAHWQGGNITKKCEECGKEFSFEKNRKGKARFCSQHCTGIWLAKHGKLPKPPVLTGANHPRWKGGNVIKKCEECEKEFSVQRIREKSARFALRLAQEFGARKMLQVKKIQHGVESRKSAKNVGKNFL
jgi:endogenous inhibitor of DNA gyrase (YacG/DUF329 family)